MIATTRIESNETYEQDTVETIQQIFRVLYGAMDIEQAIQSVLSLLGQKYQVNRAYLVESVEKTARIRQSMNGVQMGRFR